MANKKLCNRIGSRIALDNVTNNTNVWRLHWLKTVFSEFSFFFTYFVLLCNLLGFILLSFNLKQKCDKLSLCCDEIVLKMCLNLVHASIFYKYHKYQLKNRHCFLKSNDCIYWFWLSPKCFTWFFIVQIIAWFDIIVLRCFFSDSMTASLKIKCMFEVMSMDLNWLLFLYFKRFGQVGKIQVCSWQSVKSSFLLFFLNQIVWLLMCMNYEIIKSTNTMHYRIDVMAFSFIKFL